MPVGAGGDGSSGGKASELSLRMGGQALLIVRHSMPVVVGVKVQKYWTFLVLKVPSDFCLDLGPFGVDFCPGLESPPRGTPMWFKRWYMVHSLFLKWNDKEPPHCSYFARAPVLL